MAHAATFVVIPADRLALDFFQLRTGLAGEILQKFVNYGLRLAIIGDLSAFTANSAALRDLINESNRGNSVWFLPDLGEAEKRLALKASLP